MMPNRHIITRRTFLALAGVLGLSACGLQRTSSGLRLAVAASLKNVMTALDDAYRLEHASSAAQIQSAGSGALAQQIIDGAMFDLFVAADRPAMENIVTAGIIDARAVQVVAQTTVIVIAHPDSGIYRIADLATPGTSVVLADSTVPAGRYAEQILAQEGDAFTASVHANVVSYEANVSAVLQKVVSGEAQAGIVYHADVSQLAAGSLRVMLPRNTVYAEYVAALLPGAQAPSQAFLRYLTSAEAAHIWQEFGFTPLS